MQNDEFDISRFMYAYSHTSIRIKILKEVPEYTAGNETHGPFQIGATVDLPRWHAMELIEQEAAEPVKPLILDLSVLETVVLNEQQHQALQPLDPTFYMQLRTHIQLIRKRKREAPDPSITNLETRSQALYNQILDIRLSKILRLLSLEDTRDFMKNMTDEETWIFQRLYGTVTKWREQLLQ